jgi:hypothetical protein
VAALAALVASGCYAPVIGDGDLGCSDAGLCPRGFRCGAENRCYRNPDAHAAEAGDRSAPSEAGASDAIVSSEAGDVIGGTSDGAAVAGADTSDARADTGPTPPDAGRDAGLDRGNAVDPGTDASGGVDHGVPEPPPDAGADLRADVGTAPDVRPDAGAPDAPAKKGLGAACATGSECDSNTCVDRVCCQVSCPGQCEACDTSGAPGQCAQVGSGPPHGDRTPCTGTGACAGSCDGTSRTACGFPGGLVTCSGTCPGGGLTVPGVCDGNGGCALSLQLCL